MVYWGPNCKIPNLGFVDSKNKQINVERKAKRNIQSATGCKL